MQSPSRQRLRRVAQAFLPVSVLVAMFLWGYTPGAVALAVESSAGGPAGLEQMRVEPGMAAIGAPQAPQAVSSAQTITKAGTSISRLPSPAPQDAPYRNTPEGICDDADSLRVDGWAIPNRAVEINSSIMEGRDQGLIIVWCGDPPHSEIPWTTPHVRLTGVANPSEAEVVMLRTSAGGSDPFRVFVFHPQIDSATGGYELLLPTGPYPSLNRLISVPFHVWSGGRVYSMDRESGRLRQRFATLADVTVAGDGIARMLSPANGVYGDFWFPVDVVTVTAQLVKIEYSGPEAYLTELGSWQIPVNSDGTFKGSIASELVSMLEGASIAATESSADASAQPNGHLMVILCPNEECNWQPAYYLQPGGRLTAMPRDVYATAICVDSVVTCDVDTQAYLQIMPGDSSYNSDGQADISVAQAQHNFGVDHVAVMSNGLIVNASVYDPLAGPGDEAGIAHVDFRILDENGSEIMAVQDAEAPFCALDEPSFKAGGILESYRADAATGCHPWMFFGSGGFARTWPNGKEAMEGIYTIEADVVGPEEQVLTTVMTQRIMLLRDTPIPIPLAPGPDGP